MGRILFIRGGAIGDFLLTLPAIALAGRSLPEAEIHLLAYPNVKPLAIATGLAHDARSIEHASLAGFFAPGSDLDDALAEWFASFEVVISYLYDPDHHFRDNLERAGVQTLLQGPHRMEESAISPVHAAMQLARPLESLALYLEQAWIELEATCLPPAPGRFGENKRDASVRLAIHPGSGSPRKNWSLEGWAEALSVVAKRMGNRELEIVVVGGEAEAVTLGPFEELLASGGLRCEVLDHRPLTEVAGVLGSCDLFLGHDSGLSHLAGCLGVPSLLLFGPTDPAIWAPAHPRVQVLRSAEGTMHEHDASEIGRQAIQILKRYKSPQE